MNRLEKLELRIATFLRYGVMLAGALILSGWLLNLKWTADPFFSFQMYGELPLLDIVAIYYRNENWGMLISLSGLICLITLPIIRVMLTAWLFFQEKDFLMGFMALSVFLALLASFSLGIEL